MIRAIVLGTLLAAGPASLPVPPVAVPPRPPLFHELVPIIEPHPSPFKVRPVQVQPAAWEPIMDGERR